MSRPESRMQNEAVSISDGIRASGDDGYRDIAAELFKPGASNSESQLAMFRMADDKKEEKPVELKKGEFDKIGPKAAEVLDKAECEEFKLTPQPGKPDLLEAKFAKPISIPQDPAKDGCSELVIGKNMSAELEIGPNGEYILKNIKGLTATTLLGSADVTKIEISKDAKTGDTKIKSEASLGFFSSKRERVKPATDGIMDKADQLFKRMKDLKTGGGTDKKDSKMSSLEFEPIFGIA